jgi:tellurite resistance protein TerC
MSGAVEWSATIALVVGLIGFDFWAQMRSPHEPTFRQAVRWTGIYVALAFVFGASMVFWKDTESATAFVAGYVTEWSLSVDNLFVFLVILSRFAVPAAYRQRVLLFGVALALVLRGLFIVAGAAALSHFSWVFYIFGFFLLWTALSLAREGHEDEEDVEAEYHENRAMVVVRRLVRSTPEYHGGALVVRRAGRRLVTPLLLVMVAIGTTDVLFALDSIPAIFGLTTDAYIVFAANAFALMGLRQLFFVVHGLLTRLVFLSYGLAAILAFIGVKLVFEALHENTLPFIHGGEPVTGLPTITTEFSLGVIVVALGASAIASLVATRRRIANAAAMDQAPDSSSD